MAKKPKIRPERFSSPYDKGLIVLKKDKKVKPKEKDKKSSHRDGEAQR